MKATLRILIMTASALVDRELLSGRCAIQGESLLRRVHWQ